jgi:hypothetical protein
LLSTLSVEIANTIQEWVNLHQNLAEITTSSYTNRQEICVNCEGELERLRAELHE